MERMKKRERGGGDERETEREWEREVCGCESDRCGRYGREREMKEIEPAGDRDRQRQTETERKKMRDER